MLKVHHDVVKALDNNCCYILVMLDLSLCVIVVDSMSIVRVSSREENNKSQMRYTHTSVRLNLRDTQDLEFTGVIIPHSAMVHLFLHIYVI